VGSKEEGLAQGKNMDLTTEVNEVALRARAEKYTEKVGSTKGGGVMITNDNADDVKMTKELGVGSYGEVWSGSYNGTPIAIKKLIPPENFAPDEMDQIIFDFKSEVTICSSLNHPNIVQFLGFTTKPSATIILELCDDGNLYDLLRTPIAGRPLTAGDKALMTRDMASGLAYLHARKPPLIHRDLKSPNLLLKIQREGAQIKFLRLKVDISLACSVLCARVLSLSPPV